MEKIKVQDTEVTVVKVNNEDYFCLTDMIKAKDGDFFVTDWLRNRNTLEYLGVWERVYNYGEFALIKSQSIISFPINPLIADHYRLPCATPSRGCAARLGRHQATGMEFLTGYRGTNLCGTREPHLCSPANEPMFVSR
jgi:hypothetical protein